MSRQRSWWLSLLGAAVLAAGMYAPTWGDDKDDKDDDTSGSKPAVHVVKPGLLKIDATFDGVFEAKNAVEVTLHAESWSSFKVMKAVEQGATVKKGDRLVWLDMEEIEDSIRENESSHQLSDFELQIAQAEQQLTEKLAPFELASAEHEKQIADEDLADYRKVVRPETEKYIKFSLKLMEQYVEYTQEELHQLEKMYKADDLTEETEEIILKRARNDLESATFMLEQNRIHSEQMLKELPRQEVRLQQSARHSTAAFDKLRATSPINLAKSRLNLEKSKFAHDQSADKLRKLKHDYEAMKITAPADGVVYYGHFERGQWNAPSIKFHQGDSLPSNSPFMTIIKPGPLTVRGTVPEKELHAVAVGMSARIAPVGFPDQTLKGKVTEFSLFPVSSSNYDCTLSVANAPRPLGPGMDCKVTVQSYRKADALTVPP
ncbi:MAG TPA: HlyD family efflux transporter periplasmic adaptor subunit, partial [Planctomycetaceae bacterium]|nr:HlyD family efflux transporter periplasmic adaptor subunit [Planctomycetaceae bacterium]